MPNNCNHTIHREHSHYGWDNSFAPQLTIAPGESVEFETVEASGGQLGLESTLKAPAASYTTDRLAGQTSKG